MASCMNRNHVTMRNLISCCTNCVLIWNRFNVCAMSMATLAIAMSVVGSESIVCCTQAGFGF